MINKISKHWKTNKGKTPQFINIENDNWIINTDLIDIKHTKRGFYEKLQANKLENLVEMENYFFCTSPFASFGCFGEQGVYLGR